MLLKNSTDVGTGTQPSTGVDAAVVLFATSTNGIQH